MFRVGFELECVSKLPEGSLENKLIYVDPSVEVKDDGSIMTTYTHPYAIEIVTRPMPVKMAFRNLKNILKFMSDNDIRTNHTCGLHVNISMKKSVMHRVNPEKIIAAADDLYIASEYKRSSNEYCRPWKHYVKKLADKVKLYNSRRSYFKLDLKHEFSKMVHQVYNEVWGIDDLPSTMVGDQISAKNVAINICYLHRYQYIEYRMLGGSGYEKHYDKIEEATEHFMMGQLIALNEKSDDRVHEYLDWCKG